MAETTKIATCCYCGTRAALVLSGRERHELVCRSCGAPISRLKALPARRGADVHAAPPRPPRPPKRWRPDAEERPRRRPEPPRPSKRSRRRRRSSWSRMFEEIVDVLEDVLD